MSVTKTVYPPTFGPLINLKPAGFGTMDIPEGAPPFDPGTPEDDFETRQHRALWQRRFLFLFDVPLPAIDDWGKSVMLVDSPSEDPVIKYGYPNQIATPRNFSITGDGTAPAVAFDGTADVVLTLTNLVAEKWKTPRTLNFIGTDATGGVIFDGSADVDCTLDVKLADAASKLETARTINFIGTDATGSVAFDGSANVNVTLNVLNSDNAGHAATADNATNAGHASTAGSATTAGTATTANGLANGALTVTLTGDVTGSAAVNAGTVTIATTSTGGGGGTGGSGQTQFGNTTQVWGRELTDGTTGELAITFPVPYLSANGYAIIPFAEVDASVAAVVDIKVVSRSTTGCVLETQTGGVPQPATPISYVIVGQTAP